MKIANNVEMNVAAKTDYAKEAQKKDSVKIEKDNNKDTSAEVLISEEGSKGPLLTYEELQCAIENIASSQSSILSVEQAEEMINKANANILNNAGEAIMAQANQTKASVNELTR